MGGIATFCRSLLDSKLGEIVDLRFVQTSSRRRELASSGRATWTNLVEALKDIGRFARACARRRPSIAHICTAVGFSFFKNGLCVLLARAGGSRVVLHAHCSFDRLYAGSPVWKWFCRRIFRLSDGVLVLSREWAALRHILPGARVRYLPNAIDISPYRKLASRRSASPDREVRLLYLGHLSEAKGTDDLLDAFGRLNVPVPVSLDLVGDFLSPQDEARLAAAARADFGPRKRVRLVPPVSGRDKLACFERADVFVFPSHHEGMPMAVIEAMAAGLPIAATDVGGIPELVSDGENGLLTHPRAPEDLARALDRLCRDALLRSRMGDRSLVLAEGHDMARYARELADFYAEIASPGASGPRPPGGG